MIPLPQKNGKRSNLLEDIFIILCILSIWPVVLGWKDPLYQFILYLTLAGLVTILVRRVNRFRRARKDLEQ